MMAIRILLGFVGFVMLYIAVFMFKDEEERLKDRLATWWLILEGRRERTRNRLHAFASESAATVNRWYEIVFGPSLCSLNFFITSVLLFSGFSLIAMPATQVLIPSIPFLRVGPEHVELSYVGSALAGVLLLYIVSIFIKVRTKRMQARVGRRRILIAVAASSIALMFPFLLSTPDYSYIDVTVPLAVIVVSLGCDLIAIVSTMKALRVVVSRSLPIGALALLLTLLLQICLIAVPLWWAMTLAELGYVDGHKPALADFPALLAAANLTVAIPAMVYFIAVITLLIYPPFAFLLRPLYLAQDKLPLTPNSRRALAAAGTTLMYYAAFGDRGIEGLMGFIGFPELIIFLLVGAVIAIIMLRRSKRKARVINVNTKDSTSATIPSGNPYDVFISYRRANSPDARSIYAGLEQYNLRVFLDVDNLGPGHFGERLLQCIAKTPNYIVILSPNSLDRCSDEHDWLRQEIAQAIKTKRNIIPILMPGFSFPEQHMLPDDIRDLRLNQSVSYSHEFFDAMIERVKRYLQYSA